MWAQCARDWDENYFRDSEDIRDSCEKGAGMRGSGPFFTETLKSDGLGAFNVVIQGVMLY